MRTSVIILTRDRPEDLAECLESLASQKVLPDEVVLVDNSSDTLTADYLAHAAPGLPFAVLYLRGYPQLGIPTARNTAIVKAQGDILFFLDDDTVLTESAYIATILDVYQRDRKGEIGGVAAPVTDFNSDRGFKARARLVLKTLFVLDSFNPGRVLPSGFRSRWPAGTAWVQCLHGCAMTFRRAVFEDFEFDSGFEVMPYAMSEDQDFSYRVSRHWRLLWTTATRAWHKKSSAGARLGQFEHYICIVRNHHYFMRKNLRRPINHLAFWWAMVGIFLNCVVWLVVRPTRASMDGLRGFLKGVVEVAGSYYRS